MKNREGFSREHAKQVDEELREIFDSLVDGFVYSAEKKFQMATEHVSKYNVERDYRENRHKNIRKKFHDMGLIAFETYIAVKFSEGDVSQEIPIGAYGEQVSLAAISAKEALQIVLEDDSNFIQLLGKVNRNNYAFLKRHTFQERLGGTMEDAIDSVYATFLLMTAEYINIFDNAKDLVDACLQKRLFSQLSILLPPGYTQPAINSGMYYPELLTLSDQELAISKKWKSKWKEKKEQLRENPMELFGAPATMEGCPVGKKGSSTIGETGVHKMAVVFFKYFKYFYERELEKEAQSTK